jgi:hypothetical protein
MSIYTHPLKAYYVQNYTLCSEYLKLYRVPPLFSRRQPLEIVTLKQIWNKIIDKLLSEIWKEGSGMVQWITVALEQYLSILAIIRITKIL